MRERRIEEEEPVGVTGFEVTREAFGSFSRERLNGNRRLKGLTWCENKVVFIMMLVLIVKTCKMCNDE